MVLIISWVCREGNGGRVQEENIPPSTNSGGLTPEILIEQVFYPYFFYCRTHISLEEGSPLAAAHYRVNVNGAFVVTV
jgi:hypothetical protein